MPPPWSHWPLLHAVALDAGAYRSTALAHIAGMHIPRTPRLLAKVGEGGMGGGDAPGGRGASRPLPPTSVGSATTGRYATGLSPPGAGGWHPSDPSGVAWRGPGGDI